jgi:hypothetical protein
MEFDTLGNPIGGGMSAVRSIAREKALRTARDENRPEPSETQLRALEDEAEAKNVFGVDAAKDGTGNFVQQGIGEPITAADREDLRAGRTRAVARVVAAAAIGDDHAIDYLARQTGDDGADRFRFVKRRDNDGNGSLGGDHR